jgi:CubicO group peptidase (beta-lactamase class C family)
MKFLYAAIFCLFIALATSAQITANQSVPNGYLPHDIKRVDSIVNGFMQQYHVPGLSLSIAQNDSLKLERTYGYADTALKQLVQPDSRFRIASVSKPFTAAAIMLLVEQGKLKLSDKVFGKGAVLGTTYGRPTYGKW